MTTRQDYAASGLVKSPPVVRVPLKEANRLLDAHHYLGGLRTATLAFGHEEGVTVWGVPRSRGWDTKLRAAGFRAIELVRMVGVPDHGWATSSLLAASTKLVLSEYDAAVTYADPMAGHSGAVYRAANWAELPQRAQPDGWVWRLDGRVVSRKRFYGEFGTSAYETVVAHYGARLSRELDVPKRRFYRLRDPRRVEAFLTASVKVKTWGAARCESNFDGSDMA